MSVEPGLIIFFIIWFAIAFILGRVSKRTQEKSSKTLKNMLEQEKLANEAYKQEVTQHFSETAQLFNRMTTNYRDIYEHLSKNASKLCVSNDSLATLEPLAKKIKREEKVVNQDETHEEKNEASTPEKEK